ncbi:MAG TPA: arginase family protein [Actinomycetota bacterium]|jgi:formiminoglutamase|nr:arginase family protein [Actinomycetota bacterium]
MVPPTPPTSRSLVPAVYHDPPSQPDPDFLRAAEWLQREPSDPDVRVLGVPFSALSLSGASCELTPQAVRDALWRLPTWHAGRGVDLSELDAVDVGDVRLRGLEPIEALEAVGEACSALRGRPVALIGGDNSITRPAFKGLDASMLVTLDAHHDLRAGLSNGSPVRMLLDGGLPGDRVWQIGIADQGNARAHSELADQAGINVVRVDAVREHGLRTFVDRALDAAGDRAVYVDMDLDVVDRALAPGCPAALSGGLMPGDVIDAAFRFGAHPSVVAMDIVEVDPTRDVEQVTVRLAAQVLLAFLAGVATR